MAAKRKTTKKAKTSQGVVKVEYLPPAKAGYVPDFDPDIAEEICQLVADGKNLNQICKREDLPSRSHVYKWRTHVPEFEDNYIKAREMRADSRLDQMDDLIERMINGDVDSNTARVAIDAWKWQAGKERPKYYGNQVGNDGPTKIEISWKPAQD